MKKINFAVWNIDRAAAKPDPEDPSKKIRERAPEYPGKKIREWAADKRIDHLLKKTTDLDLDFIFLQEVPDPNHIPIFSPSGYEWIPARDSELERFGCKGLYKGDLLQGIWIPHPDRKHHCSGILFYQTEKGREKHLNFREVKPITNDPVGMVCTIFHTEKQEDDILRFIGYWNNPEKNTSKRSDIWKDVPKTKYLKSFLNFLDELNNKTPPNCILTGDTNVNVRTDEEKPGVLTKTGEFLETYLREKPKIGLTLIHGNADQCSLRSKTQKNLQTRKPKWYRCDLLMASDTKKISHVSFGEESDYMWKGKFSGSDHLPLFFSYSYDDGSDNKV